MPITDCVFDPMEPPKRPLRPAWAYPEGRVIRSGQYFWVALVLDGRKEWVILQRIG